MLLKLQGEAKLVRLFLPDSFRAEVASLMAVHLPQYQASRDHLTYVSKSANDFRYFIQFQAEARPMRNKEFTVNCAWTTAKSWPERAHVEIPFATPRSEPDDPPPGDEYRFRIGFLFPPHKDHWWELTRRKTLEEMIASLSSPIFEPEGENLTDEQVVKLQGLVEDAIFKCRDHVIPYFQKYAQK